MATRRERVVLELEDQFTTGMARAAASAALLNRELDSLSHDSVRTRRSISDIDSTTTRFGRNTGTTGREVDKLSGRMRIFADIAAVLGPSLIPIGAVGIPAVTGLAAQLGFAAGAAGAAVLAFQGVGDALKALNTAALHPTQQNLEKAQVALEALSPQAQDFVAQVGHMIPELRRLRDVAAAGLFPGLTTGLSDLETALPRVQGVVSAVASELGNIGGDVGASLASDRWTPFLDFLGREAPSALADMATAAGHTAHAVAELWMATDPLNDDFSKWLVDATADIDRWAGSLAKTQGFADFIDYVETTGPKVAAALGAIANAAIQIIQAAAPLGGPVLDGVKALADLVAGLADSDIGTPLFTAAAALALFNRTLAVTSSIQKGTLFGTTTANLKSIGGGIRGITADLALMNREALRGPGKGFIGPLTEAQTARGRLKQSLAPIGRATALLGGLTIASTGAFDKIGLTNTASLALMGTLSGQPWVAAVGGAIGLMIDASKASGQFADSMKRANDAMDTTSVKSMTKALKDLEQQQSNQRSAGGNVGRAQAGVATQMDATSRKVDELKAKIEFTRQTAQTKLLADGFIATADGIDSASTSTQDFIDSLQKLNDFLTGRASMRDFEQAIDDFTDRQKKRAKVLSDIQTENADFAAQQAKTDRELAAAKKKGDTSRVKDLSAQRAQEKRAHDARVKDLQTESDTLKNSLNIDKQAGRDTTALLDNIATTALKVAQGLDPVKRTEFLAGARAEYVKAAVAAGMAKDAAEDLANHVLGLSKVKGQPKIVIDATGAWHVIDETARRLSRLTRPTYKLTIKAQAGAIIPQVLDAQAKADGGTVLGPRRPYRDKVLTMLAPGEEVITNRYGEADRFRADRAAGRIPGYANGGTVQPFPAAYSAPAIEIDYDRLARAMSAVRPLYGDVHISGDPTTFRRQMQADRRAAAIGGVPRG